MPLTIAVVILLAATLTYTLFIRVKDIPPPDPVSPTQHLDERKATIYENLRDLQFEYRLDKLSDADYQAIKLDLQKELAAVMAETDRIKAELGVTTKSVPKAPPGQPKKPVLKCDACGGTFDKPLKFCGECGKPMGGGA